MGAAQDEPLLAAHLDVDEVPPILLAVGEDKEGAIMIPQQPLDH